MLRTPGRAARYLIFACWLRYTLSSLHEFTYREALPGLRWVALGSLLIIAAGVLLLDKRRFLSSPFLPVALISGLMLVSGIVNHTPAGAIDPILRSVFFVVIAVALWQALENSGPTVLKRLLIVFLPPLTYAMASVVLGVAKSGEIDGSVSYIGGFYHEELFSSIAATCLLVAVLAPRIQRSARVAAVLLSLAAVYAANYRTTILALTPLAVAAILSSVPGAFDWRQRKLLLAVVPVAGAILIFFAATLQADRFSDLRAIATEGPALIKPPETFTSSERRALSSRPYIWSTYIYAYKDAAPLQRFIGFGPDSWVGKFPHYAHNTLISFLYELGIAGVAAILLVWITMLRLALKVEREWRTVVVAGHVSFFVLNMATMPHWQIEGNIFYGLLCGFTIAKARVAQLRATAGSRTLKPALSPAAGPALLLATPRR
ncbi:MAG: O-antigen ligase family protein [Sphingomicrobium sp.]